METKRFFYPDQTNSSASIPSELKFGARRDIKRCSLVSSNQLQNTLLYSYSDPDSLPVSGYVKEYQGVYGGVLADREYDLLSKMDGMSRSTYLRTPFALAKGTLDRVGDKKMHAAPAIAMTTPRGIRLERLVEGQLLGGAAQRSPDAIVVAQMTKVIALAYGELHAQGFAHGNLCPRNIFIRSFGVEGEPVLVELFDFHSTPCNSFPAKTSVVSKCEPRLMSTEEMRMRDLFGFGRMIEHLLLFDQPKTPRRATQTGFSYGATSFEERYLLALANACMQEALSTNLDMEKIADRVAVEFGV